MPSPLLLASRHPADLPRVVDALSPLSDGEGDSTRLNRRARFHDPEDIASKLARALKGTHKPDVAPLIEILPSLSHEQVMELRAEYKHIVKTGTDRKGVNIAKHIRARLKDEDPLLMKACYAVALGQWEGESYWANFWYQGDKTRRELLIESLMGRTNEEVHRIKESFSDKKYDNSLTKCMKTELKEDKFKKAVLMVLEERRMEEYDYEGRRLPLDYKLIDQDVEDLYKAVRSDKGGETMMITIVVQRSDGHLRSVLKEYEHQYRSNFARDALKKSGNLVVCASPNNPKKRIRIRIRINANKRPNRANSSHTSSTASSTAPSATPSCYITPSPPPARTPSAESCSSRASCASTGTPSTCRTSRRPIASATARTCRMPCARPLAASGGCFAASCALLGCRMRCEGWRILGKMKFISINT
jgi:hypothetical protein